MKRYSTILVWLFLALPLWAAAGSPQQKIQKLLDRPDQKKTQFSIHFVNLDTGATVFEHYPDQPLMPASNMKLVTTAAAVIQLGADFTYQTTFALLDDDLVIIAAGDPLTGDPALAEKNQQSILLIFEQICQQLQQREITSIAGDLIIDNTIFDDVRFHPSWPADQANNWYAAEMSALNFNDNCLDLYIVPTQPGRNVEFYTDPKTAYVNIINHCKTKTAKPNTSWAARTPGTNDITLKGECYAKQQIFVTIDRPSAYFGFLLAEYLLDHNIEIKGKLIIKKIRDDLGHPPVNLDPLLIAQTPLQEVLIRCNQRSLNLAAECLFKTLGAYHNLPADFVCLQGSWDTGKAAVEQFLNNLNIPSSQYRIDDGCGLSRNNLLSARCITTILKHMHQHPAAEMFRQSLATPGKGTLRKRAGLNGNGLEDRIFAKTGYITGVRALSGYCQSQSGQWLAFSILTNQSNTMSKQVIDQIVTILME